MIGTNGERKRESGKSVRNLDDIYIYVCVCVCVYELYIHIYIFESNISFHSQIF